MMRILVTGGAGYIGSHSAKTLARSGYRPIILDNPSTRHRSAVKMGPLVMGDLEDQRLVRETLKRYRVDAVVHLPANAAVAESMTNPYKYLRHNVVTSFELFEAMREAGVNRIVVSSSCAIYGVPRRVRISKTEVQKPLNPSGESKLFVERALEKP